MRDALEVIEEALQRKGMAAATASRLALGHDSAIKNLRASKASGRQPQYSVHTLEALAKVLDLELYFGPRRESGVPPEVEVDDDAFAVLPLHDAEIAAGPGAANLEAPEAQLVAFRQDWLSRLHIARGRACLVKVRGDSMAPTLRHGDLALIDGGRTRIVTGRVYAFVDIDGQTRVKRLDHPDPATLVLRSDNPDHPVELRRRAEMNALTILGEIAWSAHTWRS